MAGDFDGADTLTKATGVSALPPITITDAAYSVQAADFNRPSVVMVSVLPRAVTLPLLTEEIDGGLLEIIIGGAGNITPTCSGTNNVLNSSHTSITGSDKYGSIQLRACYALGIYVMVGSKGHWAGN